MPIREYSCTCGHAMERIELRDLPPPRCECGKRMRVQPSLPAVIVWNAERKFPNVSRSSPDGSASFPSRAAYESHLKQSHMVESSTDGRLRRSHGATVYRFPHAAAASTS